MYFPVTSKPLVRSAIAVLLTGVFALPVTATPAPSPLSANEIDSFTDKPKAKSPRMAIQKQGETNQRVRYIVQLQGLSVAESLVQSQKAPVTKGAGNIVNNSKSQVSHFTQSLKTQQRAVTQKIQKAFDGAKVLRDYSMIFNGIAVELDPGADLSVLMAISGVKAIFPEELVSVDMDASVSLIEATQVWQALGGHDNAGKGVKVAVIDSGIRPESEMFHDAGMLAPTGLPTDDYCRTANPSFCNNKLIVARFSQPTFPVYQATDGSGNPIGEYMSPLGYSGHGTHVAGTIAGRQISISHRGVETEISGVAPGAYIMSYKALFATPANPASSSGSNIMLLEALDWAVRDGADVINNSWGGSAGAHPDTSPYKAAFEAAEAAGVVVVSSAGNSGPGAKTVGCPGCIESGITVANTTTGRIFGHDVVLSGAVYPSIQSSGNLLTSSIDAPLVAAKLVNTANEQGCNAWPADTFTGKVALVSRGTCSFDVKANMAMNAGAIGLIVYNNSAAAPIVMSMPTATIPAVMVSQTAGNDMVTALSASADASVSISAIATRQIDAQYADNMANSSSRGPNGDSSVLKPDLAAPGSNILSAVSPDTSAGALFAEFTGTSMASPHVAGAAAVIKGIKPNLSPKEIKTLLTSTTHTVGLKKETVTTNADAFDVGAGRLDLDAASKGVLSFDKASNVNNYCAINCAFRRVVKNHANEETQWRVDVSFTDTRIRASSPTSSLTVAANATANVDVNVDTSYAPANAWYFGRVSLVDVSGQRPTQHLPIVVFGHNADDATVLTIGSSSGATAVGSDFNVSSTLTNAVFSDTVQLQLPIPEGSSYVANSVATTVSNGTQNGVSYDVGAKRILWVGNLNKPVIALNPVSSAIEDISPNGNSTGTAATCSATCDDTFFTSNLGSFGGFLYNGTVYTTMQYSSNGALFAGSQTSAGSSFNQNLPSIDAPNNVLAPLWADFDLLGTAPGDSGAGVMYNKTAVEADGFTYRTIQWDRVALYGDNSGTLYTFQIKIRLGGTSESIQFNYLSVPNMPAFATIGAEDSAGKIGVSRYFNGTGNAVGNNQSLAVSTVAGGKVIVNYSAKADSVSVGNEHEVSVDEDSSKTVDLLSMISASELKLMKAKVLHQTDGGQLNAVNTLAVTPAGAIDPAAMSVLSPPSHGAVVLASDGKLDYTPAANYAGDDRVQIAIKDIAGNAVGVITLKFAVQGSNDVPTVSAGTDKSASGNAVVTLTGSASDVDGEALTYRWTQLSGTTVNLLSPNAAETRFSAPNKSENLTFRLTVTDAAGASASDDVSVAVTALVAPATPSISSGGGGSFAWGALLLLGLMFRRHARR